MLMDVWKSVTIVSGEQCAMIYGDKMMLKLPVDSLDSLPMVTIAINQGQDSRQGLVLYKNILLALKLGGNHSCFKIISIN